MSVENFNVSITADASQFNKQLKAVQKELDDVAKQSSKEFAGTRKQIDDTFKGVRDTVKKSLDNVSAAAPATKLAASFGKASDAIAVEGRKAAGVTEASYASIKPDTQPLTSTMDAAFEKIKADAKATGEEIQQYVSGISFYDSTAKGRDF